MGRIELNTFDIYLARVIFEEIEGSKIRPVIYLGKDTFLLTAIYVSSTEGKDLRPGDVELKQWEAEDLIEVSSHLN